MFEELASPYNDGPSTVSTVSRAAVGTPAGSLATDSTMTVEAPTGSNMAVDGTATEIVSTDDSTMVNEEVINLTHPLLPYPQYLTLSYVESFCMISINHYIELMGQASFLLRKELNLTLMGSIMSSLLTDEVMWSRHKPVKRSRFHQ